MKNNINHGDAPNHFDLRFTCKYSIKGSAFIYHAC